MRRLGRVGLQLSKKIGGRLIDCAGFRDFEIWHLQFEEIQTGFVEIASAAQQ